MMHTFVIAVALLFFVATAQFDPSRYDHSTQVMSGRVQFFWRIENGSTPQIHFALTAPTLGWIGFGISDPTSGRMPGADIVMATVVNGQLTVGDYHATGFVTPSPDCNATSDWIGVGFTQDVAASRTTIELRRLLAGNEPFGDRDIVNDGIDTKLIFAFGTSANTAVGHGANAAMAMINLFRSTPSVSIAALRAAAGTEILPLRMGNITVPARATTYMDSRCSPTPPITTAGKPYLVGFDIVVTPGNGHLLHHFVLNGYTYDGCRGTATMLYGAGSHHVPYLFPDDVAVDMSLFKSFSFQMHYDNRLLTQGIRDNSGVDMLFMRTPRQRDVGVLQTADPFVLTQGAIPRNLTTYEYVCPGTCTMMWESDIVVFADILHMHETGRMMQVDIERDGRVVHTIDSDFFDFHMQETRNLPRFTIRRGDTIRTRCTYHNDGASSLRFGLGSSEEMCIWFASYVPRQSALTGSYCGLSTCGGFVAQKTVSTAEELGRGYGSSCREQKRLMELPPPTPAPPRGPALTPAPLGGAATRVALFGATALLLAVIALA